MSELTTVDWSRVDSLLSKSQVLQAVMLHMEITGCGIGEAKAAIGERFRLSFPELFRQYRNVEDDD